MDSSISQRNHLDDVEKKIYEYLTFDKPRSFLLFAGAGSGKTRTLVNVLREIRKRDAQRLSRSGQKIAIITYTNAACDEIKHRLEHDPVFCVSTIHSFAYDLIKPFTENIRSRLKTILNKDIKQLDSAIEKAKDKQGKTALKNKSKKDKQDERLHLIDSVSVFRYSPDSGNTEKGSLQHAEVIAIAASLLAEEPLMQKILTNRFPVLLIDESQDTNKALLEAFIVTQQENKDKFCLGLFGDMMQRIYGGGKPDMDTSLPADWEKPEKKINHRCPQRIVKLINQIRCETDTHQQESRSGAADGFVRIFIVDAEAQDKSMIENDIRERMSRETNDQLWRKPENVKDLILEHHMAASRGGFADFLLPLLDVEKLRDTALNGQSSEIKFIKNQVVPFWKSLKDQNEFVVADILRCYSPLLKDSHLEKFDNQLDEIKKIKLKVDELHDSVNANEDLLLIDFLRKIRNKNILSIPDSLSSHLSREYNQYESNEDADLEKDDSQAWWKALQAPLEQVCRYSEYTDGKSGFATHQGVKGLQFERVVVILDDKESRGFQFKYEELFGATKSKKQKTSDEGESNMERTRRLFYVTCSRAQKSLAVVAYTKNPQSVKQQALKNSWFAEKEIICINEPTL